MTLKDAGCREAAELELELLSPARVEDEGEDDGHLAACPWAAEPRLAVDRAREPLAGCTPSIDVGLASLAGLVALQAALGVPADTPNGCEGALAGSRGAR